MSYQAPIGLPGVGTTRAQSNRTVRKGHQGARWMEGGKVIKAANSRDPDNTGYITTLRAGLIMGKVTSGGLYAPSIYGILGSPYASGTSITLPAQVVTELVRRKGASGTFKLTGPPAAAGVVRTLTITYSGTSATTATITDPNVNEVQTLTPTTAASAGTFALEMLQSDGLTVGTTGPLAYNASVATIQTALDLASGVANGVVLTTAASAAPISTPAAMVFTFSGTGYAGLPAPNKIKFLPGTGLTGETKVLGVVTTAGVNGQFFTGSFIQPVDGSETPLCLIDDGDGIKVVDVDGNNVDVPFPLPLVGGSIVSANIINWPADTSARAWLVGQLDAVSNGAFSFDHLL